MLQFFRAAVRRGRTSAFVVAVLVVLTVGATTADAVHIHDEEGEDAEHCSLCVICGVDDACAPTSALPQQFAVDATPTGDLAQRSRRTPLYAYRARAPPLSR